MPGERFAGQLSGFGARFGAGAGTAPGSGRGAGPGASTAPASGRGAAVGPRPGPVGEPFFTGEIADRGPIERPAIPLPEPRAREVRELERQRAWAMQATRALNDYRAEGVEETPDADEDDDTAEGLNELAALRRLIVAPLGGTADGDIRAAGDSDRDTEDVAGESDDPDDPDDLADSPITMRATDSILPTLRVLPHGVNRKRLEQAIKELNLPVIIARDSSEADVVMTLKAEYRQKTAGLREAEDRGLPIYVLKSNTIVQMGASLTSIFSLEIDPREAALREAEEAIGMVIHDSSPVELSPQNAYIRRLQHQMAERANLVSRSRGREPYRRVRLYP